MTPAERLVVESAVRLTRRLTVTGFQDLVRAVRAYQATQEAGPSQERTWGEVVEGDEILSVKNGKWYLVIGSRRQGERMAVTARGPGVIKPKADDPVTLRRGPSGKAVDVIASVVWSHAAPATVLDDDGAATLAALEDIENPKGTP